MKKLLAIAVAAALVAPAAAMADTTLYGKLHASVGQVKTTTGGVTTKATGVESHSSRIGIKGATALDNGMEATYGLEYGLNIDGDNGGNSTAAVGANGSAAQQGLSARNTFVGVKGNFGEVRVGRHDTPAKLATAGQDVFADTYADLGNIINADNHRVNNAVAYINKFGPVGFAYAHATGTGMDSATLLGGAQDPAFAKGDNGADADTLMVNYGNGPWYAGLGYTKVKSNTGAAFNGYKGTNLGLGWKAEAGHQANLILEDSKSEVAADGKNKSALINGVYKMGNVALKAQYGERKHSGSAAALNGKEKLTSVGADYNLGKKTAVYLLHSDNKNTGATVGGLARTKATAVGLVTEF